MPKPALVVSIERGPTRSRAGVREAILEHLDGLYRFALRLTRDPHLAQELTQESALRAWERRHTIVSDPRAWLFQTLYHTFISRYRRSLREESGSGDPAEDRRDLALRHGVSPGLPPAIAVQDVRSAIEALPEELRVVVWLSDAEGFRLREIAEMLEWPPGTAASRLWRARQQLRRLLAAYGPPEEKQV